MATTLSYGFVKPQDGDRGSVWFDALEDDIQQLNDHTHNGTNSAKIESKNISATTDTTTIVSGSWGAVAGKTDVYKQTVTMPTALDFDDHIVKFRDKATGHYLELTTEKVSDTTYDVYINDNTLNLEAYYLS